MMVSKVRDPTSVLLSHLVVKPLYLRREGGFFFSLLCTPESVWQEIFLGQTETNFPGL